VKTSKRKIHSKKPTQTSSRKKVRRNPFDQMVGRYGVGVVFGICMLLGIVIFWDFLSLQKIFYFKDIGSDTINQGLTRILNQSLYGSGHFDLANWSFYNAMGMPYGGNGIKIPTLTGMLQQVSGLFGGSLAVYAISYKVWLNWGLCSILGFLYLRVLGLNRFTAVVGGLLLAFCGENVAASTWHSEVLHIQKCIFILLSFELLLSRRIWWLLPIALYTLSIPDLYFYTQFLTLYALVRIIAKYGWDWKKIGIIGAQSVALGLLSIVFRAPHFLRGVQRILDSPRVSGASSYSDQLTNTPIFSFEEALHYATAALRSFHNDMLGMGSDFQGWYNYLEAPTFYIGVLTLLLVPLAFPYFNRRQKIVYGTFLLVWGLIVTFPFFRYAFYKFAGNYYKKALSIFIPVSLWVIGMHALHIITQGKKLKWWWLGISVAGLFALLYYPYPIGGKKILSGTQMMVSIFILLYAGLLFLVSQKKYYRIALGGILLVVVGEIIIFNQPTLNQRPVITQKNIDSKSGFNDYTIEAANFLRENDSNFYRVTKDYFSGLAKHSSINDAAAQGFYSTPSYRSHNPKSYIDFLTATGAIGTDDFDTRWSMGVRNQPLLRSLLSTKYAFTKANTQNFQNQGYSPIKKFNNITVLKNNFHVPLGVAYDKYILYDDFKKLKPIKRQIGLMKAVVLTPNQVSKYPNLSKLDLSSFDNNYESTEYETDVNLLRSDSLAITEVDKPDSKIRGTVSLDQPKMLFFAIPYDAGWGLSVNGEEGDLEVIDVGMMGVMLPKGTHEIALQYQMPNRTAGTIVMLLAFAIFLSLIGRQYRTQVVNSIGLYAGLGSIFVLTILPIPLSQLLVGIVFMGMLFYLPKGKKLKFL